MHKIDSTLRGNWAAELAALVEGGRRVVLIPSHPACGRVCIGGVVYVDGVPVAETEHGNDPRLPVRSSRAGDALAGDELAGVGCADDMARGVGGSGWRSSMPRRSTRSTSWCVVALGAADVVLAGPAAVVACRGQGSALRLGPAIELRRIRCCHRRSSPCVPACIPPVAPRSPALADVGVEVVMSSEIAGQRPGCRRRRGGRRAHERVAALEARSVILVGGDTAAAFIGDNVVRVFGSIGVGVSLGEAEIRGTTAACSPPNRGASARPIRWSIW